MMKVKIAFWISLILYGIVYASIAGATYYQQEPIITVDTFENLADYTISGTGGRTVEENTNSQFIFTGSKSIKVTAPASGNVIIDKAISLNMSQASMWCTRVYVENTNVASIQIYTSQVSNFASHLNASQSFTSTGWKLVRFRRSSWSATGGEDWTTNKVIVRFRMNANAGGTASLYWDASYSNCYARPQILFGFDDGSDDHYNDAYPYLQARGMKGTFFIPTGSVGDAGKMTWAQLKEMSANGHDIANHTRNHTDLSTLGTQAEMEAEINAGISDLVAQGLGRASRYLAYPNGGYNSTVIAAATATGTIFSRTIVGGPIQQAAIGIDRPQELECRSLSAAISLATAKAYIDDAIMDGKTLLLLNHGLVAAAPAGNQWLLSDWKALVDYAYSKRAQADFPAISSWDRHQYNERKERSPN